MQNELSKISWGDQRVVTTLRRVAAGLGSGSLKYSIVPGNPDASILLFRMTSNKPAIMMPETGRSMAHKEGVALIREWIQSLENN